MSISPKPLQIILDEVMFHYGNPSDFVLENLSLSLNTGRISCLVGPNGAGKSTLVKLLLGLLEPTDGEIYLIEESVKTSLSDCSFGSHLFYPIFQNPENQIVATTVFDDVAFVPENRGMDRASMMTLVSNSITRAGLSGFENANPQMLSGGQKQRLAIAGALAAQTRFLILDEPTAMLDPLARLNMFVFLQELAETGMGILLISHIVDEVRHAENIYCLESGKVDCFSGFNDFAYSGVFRSLGWEVGIRDGLERLVDGF